MIFDDKSKTAGTNICNLFSLSLESNLVNSQKFFLDLKYQPMTLVPSRRLILLSSFIEPLINLGEVPNISQIPASKTISLYIEAHGILRNKSFPELCHRSIHPLKYQHCKPSINSLLHDVQFHPHHIERGTYISRVP